MAVLKDLIVTGNSSFTGETSGVKSIEYTTVAPTADNSDGLKIVVLDTEPTTKYNGYIYMIKET